MRYVVLVLAMVVRIHCKTFNILSQKYVLDQSTLSSKLYTRRIWASYLNLQSEDPMVCW